jgi:quinoprotein glucose dehydrogenase
MQRIVAWALIVILALMGAGLSGGGAVLIRGGGSPYYLVAGIALLACAFALVRRSGAAILIYAGLLIATLIWSLWEVGLDGWQLAPRLIALAVIGLLFMSRTVTAPSGSRWWIAASGADDCRGHQRRLRSAGRLRFRRAKARATSLAPAAAAPTEWRHWGNTLGGTRYVPANQIDTRNVQARHWRGHTTHIGRPSQFQASKPHRSPWTGASVVCLQPGIVAALDQDTGREIWRYTMPDFERIDFGKLWGGKCRGVSYYEAPHALPDCPKRILFSRPDGFLMAVDAATGQVCPSFRQTRARRICASAWATGLRSPSPPCPHLRRPSSGASQ